MDTHGGKHKMREFDTGATRDSNTDKLDYEGFFSPLVMERFAQYMHKHRTQADGQMRASDNWQKGIPVTVYFKSLYRHFIDLWMLLRGYPLFDPADNHKITKEEACCAIMFNVMGILHEFLKGVPK